MTPRAGLVGLREAVRSLRTEFSQARLLAWRFFLRDTRAEHRQSLFGYVWLLVTPLANTAVWVFLNGQNVINIDSGRIPYPIFVLSGTVLWTAFIGSLTVMLGTVTAARGVLGKVSFPHEALVYSAFLKSGLDALVASIVLIPAAVYFEISWQPAILLYPLALFASLMLGSAIGLIVLPFGALYSDVGRAVQLVVRFGFFVTPVVFNLPAGGIARQVMLLNPVTYIIVSGRAWLTGSGQAMPTGFLSVVAGSFVLLAIGFLFLKMALPHLIERLSS